MHKDAHDPFNGGNGMEEFLSSGSIDTLLITGGKTDNCVSATTYVSLGKGYRSVVLEDCVYAAGYKWNTTHKSKLREFAANESILVTSSTAISFR